MFALLPLLLFAGQAPVPDYKRANVPVERRIRDLVGRMTLEEKARQLDMYAGAEMVSGRVDNTHAAVGAHLVEDRFEKAIGTLGAGSIHDLYPSPELANEIQKWVITHSRLGIPALFIEEAVHGYNGIGNTLFPCSINLASTWDTDLAGKTAAAIASEARASGVHFLLCPVLDVAREPRWGRIEEDFGEDPYLSGELGAAYVHGMQGDSLNTDHTVASEPKHFAGHGVPEGGLNASPVHAGEREVRSILLKSFEPAIRESHAMGIMAAYHEIDGVPCAANPWLLTTVLRKEWDFQGFVLSDLGAIAELYNRHHVAATPADAVRLALKSGVDMQFYDFSHDVYQGAIVNGVRSGKLSRAVVDQAVSRVLRVKFELGLFDHPYVDTALQSKVQRSSDHVDAALISARESICLLKNENHSLPLSKDLKTIAVIGPNASVPRMGDYTPPGVKGVSLVDGIRSLLGEAVEIRPEDGSSLDAAVASAKGADVAVLALGEREGISGEGSDRSNLGLPENQEQLLEAVVATGTPTVLVLQNGRPLTIAWAKQHVPAIVEAWYPGEKGGQAIAEVLFGQMNPGGKLPVSFPRTVGAIPSYYNHDPSKGDNYVDGSAEPLFPFGSGLSYTSFSYDHLSAKPTKNDAHVDVLVNVDVTNSGKLAGDEVVQLYLRPNTSSVETPLIALKGFQRVRLAPGEKRTVTFHLRRKQLEIWGASRAWAVEDGTYTVQVGGSSATGLRTQFALGH